ncbi:hypothetical protein D1007_01559 [Hordeum vulgare]|nr:hypothetical protein D1007_01559 [Hordeum vulgare]
MALQDDDLLREIVLRLSPLPSSLPRASAVCKRWRGLVTDPGFLRSFRDHHRKEGPPLLGFFVTEYPEHYEVDVFHPILDPPDRVPLSVDVRCPTMLGCRHGRVLIVDGKSGDLVVCDPITGQQQRVPIPTELDAGCLMGTVMPHGQLSWCCHMGAVEDHTNAHHSWPPSGS